MCGGYDSSGLALKCCPPPQPPTQVKLVVAKTVPLEVAPLNEVHQQLLVGSGIRGKVVIAVAKQ